MCSFVITTGGKIRMDARTNRDLLSARLTVLTIPWTFIHLALSYTVPYVSSSFAAPRLPDGYTSTFRDGRWTPESIPRRIDPPDAPPRLPSSGAFFTGTYRNLFVEYGYDEEDVARHVDATFEKLFFGDESEERVYFESENDTAYVWSVDSNDVRTEGMSYGMIIAVQRDNRTMFDALWKFATTFMRHNDPKDERFGYFAWHTTTDGRVLDPNPASDGETYFATALYMASARWNEPSYRESADELLSLSTDRGTGGGGVSDMFVNNTGVDGAASQVVFVPYGQSASFTDPSYHTPAFYELWYRSFSQVTPHRTNATFWIDLARSARSYFQRTATSETNFLTPDYSTFDGEPTGSGDNRNFAFDAWRVALNVAIDYAWFATTANAWHVRFCNGLLAFFETQNATSPYANQYDLSSGRPTSSDHSPGLVACNAVCGLASNKTIAWTFVSEFWETPIPSGKYRYYDGMLYLMALLHVSGRFKYYGPFHPNPTPRVPSSSTTPLFVTFDAGIPPSDITPTVTPFLHQIKFVWGASTRNVDAWRRASPNTSLSYYMPYSRSPAASVGFDLAFWLSEHPDWILYRCDRRTVAFWDGESGNTGSVPLDFTSPDVIEWQVRNQSTFADAMGYDAMAFDNFGGGARAGANPGQACGVFDRNGTWSYRFGQMSDQYNDTASRPVMIDASVAWLESVRSLMRDVTPRLDIVPNLCVDNAGWVDSDNAKRVAESVTGILSERGFSSWGAGRIQEHELLDEYRWMEMLSSKNKSYYSINEISSEEWSETWIEWCLGAFFIGMTDTSALWIGTIQGYGSWSYQSQFAANLGSPVSRRYRTGTDWPILMRRNFSNGCVLLNPSQTSATALLTEEYFSLNGSLVSPGRLILDAQTARVLLHVH